MKTRRPDLMYLSTADYVQHKHAPGTPVANDYARVVLPITDPYVVHHGALGSFATVYLPPEVAAAAVCEALCALPGIDTALPRQDAATALQLPADRIGDVVVLADRFTVLGITPAAHDLSGLDAPLRSHDGRGEQGVPLIVNRAAPGLDRKRRFRNFDVFDIALNEAQ